MATKTQFKAIDFFCGAGGLTCGLKSAGIDVLAGIDNDGSCKFTYEKNNKGSIFLERDVTKLTVADFENDVSVIGEITANAEIMELKDGNRTIPLNPDSFRHF